MAVPATGGCRQMEATPSLPNLSRNENDAATALGAFLLAMLVLLATTVLALHFLSGLPAIMVYGFLFAVVVFAAVCGAAFLKSDLSPRRPGPPQLEFRNPARRRSRRSADRPKKRG